MLRTYFMHWLQILGVLSICITSTSTFATDAPEAPKSNVKTLVFVSDPYRERGDK